MGAAGPGGRGGRRGARRAHHQNFGRVLQLSDHFWGAQRRRHHGLSSMTRHALHSGSGAAADQSVRLEGQRAPQRLWLAAWGRGRGGALGSVVRDPEGAGRVGGEDSACVLPAWRFRGLVTRCCGPAWKPALTSPFSDPRSAPRGGQPCERVLGSPFQKACVLRPSLRLSWPQKSAFRMERSFSCERCPGGLGQQAAATP